MFPWLIDEVDDFLRVDAAVEDDVRAMLLQVHGAQVPEAPQATGR